MAALKEPVKIFIVQALACRDTPQEVADQVLQEFGITIDRKQCQSYDPTKVAGKNLSPKFKKLFDETRKKFDAGLVDIPIAKKHYRMKQYDKLLQKTKNTVMALRIMEQAAKDSGGLYTNKQEVDHTTKGESINKPTTIELVAPNVQSTD
ncbi:MULTISPECIES: DUF2280 domain-containing protein [Acinetobacter]|uniref:DUF2280 domain-containing protein n=1 Tax=Acinetobacter TaxID=469 RepID=UPI0021CCD4FA|nr:MULTISPECIES: DUF2280 domain-containing protein [Acinetobacter]